jgi:hypothetical protein
MSGKFLSVPPGLVERALVSGKASQSFHQSLDVSFFLAGSFQGSSDF